MKFCNVCGVGPAENPLPIKRGLTMYFCDTCKETIINYAALRQKHGLPHDSIMHQIHKRWGTKQMAG